MTLLHDDRVDLLPVFWLLDSALVKKTCKFHIFLAIQFGKVYIFQPVQVHSRKGSINLTSVGCSYTPRLFMKDQWMTCSFSAILCAQKFTSCPSESLANKVEIPGVPV